MRPRRLTEFAAEAAGPADSLGNQLQKRRQNRSRPPANTFTVLTARWRRPHQKRRRLRNKSNQRPATSRRFWRHVAEARQGQQSTAGRSLRQTVAAGNAEFVYVEATPAQIKAALAGLEAQPNLFFSVLGSAVTRPIDSGALRYFEEHVRADSGGSASRQQEPTASARIGVVYERLFGSLGNTPRRRQPSLRRRRLKKPVTGCGSMILTNPTKLPLSARRRPKNRETPNREAIAALKRQNRQTSVTWMQPDLRVARFPPRREIH